MAGRQVPKAVQSATGKPQRKAVRLRVADAAKADIEDLLAWSEHRFGTSARQRYEALIACALLDIAEDAARPGVRQRPELGAGMFSFHLFFSRKRAQASLRGQAAGRVQRPRHFVVARTAPAGFVDILRVLHDAMELSRHVPVEGDDQGG